MEDKSKKRFNSKVKRLRSTNIVPKIQCKLEDNTPQHKKLNPTSTKEATFSDLIVKRSDRRNITDFSLNNDKITVEILKKDYDNYEKAKCSTKAFGPIKSFGYNTYIGLSKETNEDKIFVSGQLKRPEKSHLKIFPKISYFGIFDGHGGESCSTFLAEKYLDFLCEDKNFPFDMKTAIIDSFERAETEFLKKNEGKPLADCDISGSCALVAVAFDNRIYIGNIGDSRAIISVNAGKTIKSLTIDHKPNNLKEYQRAKKAGSQIYLDKEEGEKQFINNQELIDKYIIKNNKDFIKDINNNGEYLVFRESPSDLAVMRTIGDIKAKKKEFGGNPGSIISKPDVYVHDCSSTDDFIIMGCDGIFDDLTSEQVVDAAWFVFRNMSKEENYNIHTLSQNCCDMVIKYGLDKLTTDNLSCIVIGLEGLEKFLTNKCCREKIKNEIDGNKRTRKFSNA